MTALTLFLLPILVLLMVCRGRLETGLLVSLGLGQWLAGAYLVRDPHPRLLAVCVLATACFVLGYALGFRGGRDGREGGCRWGHGFRSALPWLSLTTVALVVFHFARGGVPLLSADVETMRFQMANSGLLGLPSRAYLFGLPIMVLAYAGIRRRSLSETRMLVLVASAFVASRIFGGLKSGLLEVTFVALIALMIQVRGTPRLLSAPVLRRVLIGVAAVLFAGFLATQYATVRTDSARATAEYLVQRVTRGTVPAGGYAVDLRGRTQAGPHLLEDFLYYMNRYGGDVPRRLRVFEPPEYDTSRLISAGLLGLSPGAGVYLTPVAPGLGPSLFLDWGWLGLILGMSLAGYALRRLQWMAIGAQGLAAGVWGAAALVLVYVVTNGGLAYYVVNFGVVALLYLAIASLLAAALTRQLPIDTDIPGSAYAAGASLRQGDPTMTETERR